ncbi:MAG: hypothetical protein M9928_17785 [Anaerolineae bacterium]|nr:hypothetical protein [Anaerolineae bacterium]
MGSLAAQGMLHFDDSSELPGNSGHGDRILVMREGQLIMGLQCAGGRKIDDGSDGNGRSSARFRRIILIHCKLQHKSIWLTTSITAKNEKSANTLYDALSVCRIDIIIVIVLLMILVSIPAF